MAFYSPFSGFYAYPVTFPHQEFYPVYAPNAVDMNGAICYENMPHQSYSKFNKQGYNNRKISQDSGISDFSSKASRKTSSTSTISNISSILEETTQGDGEPKEAVEPPVEIPSDEICSEIVEQVEFYFSDANITKDKFLLKHVKRNKEGFVSLKLISSFKRVKHLTKDWRQVAVAVEKKSNRLEVNDLKTKVRRLDPLPEYDETTPSRTVVVLNLPIERPTIEAVAEMFNVCGEIMLVRVLRPGNPIPADVRPFFNKHPEMTSKVCALVEYEKTEFALKAIKQLNNEEDGKMKVMEMTAPPPIKTGKKSDERKKAGAAKPSSAEQPQRRYSQGMLPAQMMMMNAASEAAASTSAPASGPRRKLSLVHSMKFSGVNDHQKKVASLNPNAPIFTMQQRRLSRPSQASGPTHFMVEPAFGMMPVQPFPGWMSRRFANQVDYAGMPQAVARQPMGPVAEKGKGFQKWCKTRMEPTVTRKPGSRAVPIIAPPQNDEPKVEKGPQAKLESSAEEESGAKPEVAVAPLVVPIAEESSASEEDEGHFSDNERSR